MKTHDQIDRRSLALSQAIVAKIDADPERTGLQRARATCERWLGQNDTPALRQWRVLLEQSWDDVRRVLLDASEYGKQLRQSTPFCGILSPHERWHIYKDWQADEAGTS